LITTGGTGNFLKITRRKGKPCFLTFYDALHVMECRNEILTLALARFKSERYQKINAAGMN
jgi:hypothetical protein